MKKTIDELKSKMQEIDSKMSSIIVTGESGGGLVIVKVNCNKELTSLEIDDSLYHESNRNMLKDLVIAATNKAIKEAEERKSVEIREHSSGIIPNIPGFDLGKIFNG